MEHNSRDFLTILGAMYVLTATLWAICIPAIREANKGREEFGRLYWVLALAFPAEVIFSGLSDGVHLEPEIETSLFANISAVFTLIVFLTFAFLLYNALEKLSKK